MNDTTLPSGGKKKTAPKTFGRVKRGFGLHDWIKLKQVTKDLAQRKGSPIRKISMQEVSQHSSEHDGWVVLRKKVYNLTPYLHYHPGGLDILRSSLGKDCTDLFDKYHRWVNVEGLIGNLLLGFLEEVNSDESKLQSVSEFPVPAPRLPKDIL